MSTDAPRRGHMHINLFASTFGLHPAAWRRPEVRIEDAIDPMHLVRVAQTVERGLLDALFVADVQVPGTAPGIPAVIEYEPLTLLAFAAAHTKHIGLIATMSTTFYDPFNLARLTSSLDLLSGGRAGVNIVTSTLDAEARLHGLSRIPAPEERYARAEEFVGLLVRIWDSYPRRVVRGDKASGAFFDESEFVRVDHHDTFLDFEGVSDIPASPQGHPVIVQAGSSSPGRNLAARYAELVFGVGQTFEQAHDYYADVKKRAVGFGRQASDLAILPGLNTIVADSRREAEELKRYLDSLDTLETKLLRLGKDLGLDCTGWDPDDELPELPPLEPPDPRANPFGRYEGVRRLAVGPDGGRRRIGEVLELLSGGRGGFSIVGTASEVADALSEWFRGYACDGFNLSPMTVPDGLDRFVDDVVPELQERGVFRTEYAAETLRGNLAD